MTGPVYEVVWPLGRRAADEGRELPPRLGDLNGKVIGELWNSVYKGDLAFPVIRAELKKRYPDIRFVEYPEFGEIHGAQMESVLAAIPEKIRASGCDAVIAGVGHCGACVPAALRGALAAEDAGAPSVTLIGSLFEPMAREVSRLHGVEGAALAIYPGRINDDSDERFKAKVAETVVDQIVAGLTTAGPRRSAAANEPGQRQVVARGDLREIDEYFYERRWTDGLPITPPTLERVDEFMRFTTRAPDEVLAVLLPERREATVWNVAVTGVMAGCRPEYMPVLLAIAEALCDPAYRVEDAGSGPGWETLVTVSGPIIKELDFNALTGVKRAGRRANTAVGRFTRLFVNNIAGLRIPPGTTDNGAIGNNFHVVLAEDEDTVAELDWTTFGEDCGVPRTESCVTIQSVMMESAPYGDHGGPSKDPETYIQPLIDGFGKAMLGDWLWLGLAYASWHPLIVLSQHAAKVLAENGWTKDRLRDRFWDEARVPARAVLRRGAYVAMDLDAQVAAGLIPAEFTASDDPDRLIPTIVRKEWLRFVVAGNPAMYYQRGYVGHAHGASVTKRVRIDQPAVIQKGVVQ